MSMAPFSTYVVPGCDPTWGLPKTCAYRVTRTFQVQPMNILLEKGMILYSEGVDGYLCVDCGGYSTRLDWTNLRLGGALSVGWLEAIPAVPYEKPLPRTRFERILDDSCDICLSSSVDRAAVS